MQKIFVNIIWLVKRKNRGIIYHKIFIRFVDKSVIMNSEKNNCDLLVIGGGPAGLTAAYFAAMRGLSVVIADAQRNFPKKLLITGKGRCNLTNVGGAEAFFSAMLRGSAFLRSAYSGFGSQDVCDFFESRGVELKTERGGRVFPQSDRAADIAEALKQAAVDAGVKMRIARITEIITRDGAVCGAKTDRGEMIFCQAAVIATGGLSYPATGSTGDGYAMAQALGHTTTPLRASLVPMVCAGQDCAELQGLSLKNVTLTVTQNGKIKFSELGEMLFTHFGISGPLVLSASAELSPDRAGAVTATAEIDFKPALDDKTLDRRVLRDFKENINREFKNSLDGLLPQKLIPVIVRRSEIPPQARINSITSAQRARLINELKHFRLEITALRPISEAIVTAGGINTREINPKTMESKLIKNLHFAGEVMDVDGRTGGYNLTAAFATGHAAGTYCLKENFPK